MPKRKKTEMERKRKHGKHDRFHGILLLHLQIPQIPSSNPSPQSPSPLQPLALPPPPHQSTFSPPSSPSISSCEEDQGVQAEGGVGARRHPQRQNRNPKPTFPFLLRRPLLRRHRPPIPPIPPLIRRRTERRPLRDPDLDTKSIRSETLTVDRRRVIVLPSYCSACSAILALETKLSREPMADRRGSRWGLEKKGWGKEGRNISKFKGRGSGRRAEGGDWWRDWRTAEEEGEGGCRVWVFSKDLGRKGGGALLKNLPLCLDYFVK